MNERAGRSEEEDLVAERHGVTITIERHRRGARRVDQIGDGARRERIRASRGRQHGSLARPGGRDPGGLLTGEHPSPGGLSRHRLRRKEPNARRPATIAVEEAGLGGALADRADRFGGVPLPRMQPRVIGEDATATREEQVLLPLRGEEQAVEIQLGVAVLLVDENGRRG